MSEKTHIEPGSTLWLPDFLLDEICPPPKPRPEDWLIALPPDDKGPTERRWMITDAEDERSDARVVKIGDTVAFCLHRSWGVHEIEIQRDGTFTAPIEIPAEANCFCESGDNDSFMDTIDGFARQYAEVEWSLGVAEFPLTIAVHIYQWSDPVEANLNLDEVGSPCFVFGPPCVLPAEFSDLLGDLTP